MPNDCNNIIICTHDDPAIITILMEYLSHDPPVFFGKFIPCPEDETRTSYWGTKWDVYDVHIEGKTENTLQLSFYTAWSPPFAAYEKLQKLGFTVEAMFMESGCDFCGYWKNDETVVFENVRDNLSAVPEEFHFYFCDIEEEN